MSFRSTRTALLILTFINLFNYLDRWVVAALVESLKRAPLSLSDFEAGLLTPAFIIVYMIAAPWFGRLGDRGVRRHLIAIGVALWSLATALGGLAWNFASLLVARASVGIGEAAYGTIAPTLIADYYPESNRGRALAVFFAAIPIGSALGYILGGLADVHFGWRTAFFIAGIPGALLAAICLRLPEPERGSMDAEPLPMMDGGTIRATYRRLLRNRRYAWTVYGYAAYTFAIGALAFWMPAFLERERGMSHAAATTQFGAIVVVTGFVGTFAGGWFGDWLLRRTAHAYLLFSGVITLVAAPLAVIALMIPTRAIYLPALIVSQLLMFASTGPINSAIVSYVRAPERASAVGLSILLIHLLGDAPSPALVGAISDASSLQRGVLIVPAAILIAGLIWLVAGLRAAPARVEGVT